MTATDVLTARPAPHLLNVPAGLKGVVAARTELGDVRGDEGFYHYRQYSAIELARHRAVEDVWFLLFEGHLPDAAERAAFIGEVAAHQRLAPDVLAVHRAIASHQPSGGGPLDALRTAVSYHAASLGLRPLLDLDPTERRRDAVGLAAIIPVLVGALARLGAGDEPLPPRPELSFAANLCWMITGCEPDQAHEQALNAYLVATVDHGFNASTFTARVVASTRADLGSCVTAALGALSGPLHGGAPSRVLDLLDVIGSPDRIDEIVTPLIDAGERIMGFGHAVYRTDDPRSLLLRDHALRLGGSTASLTAAFENRVVALLDARKPGRHLRPNVELYAGVVLEACGIPRRQFTPVFAASRTIGWCANVLEQARDPRIIRPSARYIGPPAPAPLPPPTAAP